MRRRNRPCYYCGCGMTKRGTRAPSSATVDHIIPTSRGGSNSPLNKVMCCRRCNNEKGNFTGVEYKLWKEAGKPNREVFKSTLPDCKERYLNGDTGTHFDWFVAKYISPTPPVQRGEATEAPHEALPGTAE